MGRTWKARVDEHNRLVLPQELARRFMLEAGQDLEIVEENGTWTIARPVSQLARVYVEPTNLCNLDCRTCMRNVWDEPLGRMSMQVAERIFQQLSEIDPTPEVFFGGYGEPLAHAQIVEMVRLAKAAGARVELITNGTLLTEHMESSLIDAGLDFLWVSLDGASAKSYADVRLGAALPEVVENIRRMGRLKEEGGRYLPELGIAFVAMKRNIRDLPDIVRLAKELGARKLSVSHVLAHHSGLRREVLYEKTMYASRNRTGTPLEISLPRMDDTAETAGIRLALEMEEGVVVNGQNAARGTAECPFVGKGSLSIRWDGKVSPCLPLLHSHESYLDRHTRKTNAFACGDILDADLLTIWKAGPYRSLRKKIQSYDYSPCVLCNTCEMSEANVEDCFGNVHPTCGGCLWAHGLIQCP